MGLPEFFSRPFSQAVTLASKGILCKATRRCLSCCLCTENTQKGHLIAPLRVGSKPQLSREPSTANSYRCTVKCYICIQITKGPLVLSLFSNGLEYCLDCELSFNRRLITLWQHSEFSIRTIALARCTEGSLVSWLQEGAAGF